MQVKSRLGAWFLGLAFLLSLLHVTGVLVPLSILIAMMWMAFLWGIFGPLRGKGRLLRRWVAVLAFLPLAVLTEHVLLDSPDWGRSMPRVWQLTTDAEVIQLMASIGAVCMLALVGSADLGGGNSRTGPSIERSVGATGMASFTLLVWGPLLMLWFSQSDATILGVTYGELVSAPSESSFGFSGLAFLAYALLIGACLDIERENVAERRLAKLAIYVTAVLFLLLVINFLRGSRNATGFVIALAALYLTRQSSVTSTSAHKRLGPYLLVVSGLAVLFIALIEVRMARAYYADGAYTAFDGLRDLSYKNQTWMGATYSLVGLSDMYLSNDMPLQWGRTYLDYALSLPPSFVADAIGYSRPIGEEGRGPSWWFVGTYTVGGIHPAVPAFANLAMPGVFLLMVAIGHFTARLDAWAQAGTYRARLYYATVFMGSLHWFWYGDMYLIRAIMGAMAADVTFSWLTPIEKGRVEVMSLTRDRAR